MTSTTTFNGNRTDAQTAERIAVAIKYLNKSLAELEGRIAHYDSVKHRTGHMRFRKRYEGYCYDYAMLKAIVTELEPMSVPEALLPVINNLRNLNVPESTINDVIASYAKVNR